jgi:hypothetical protein
VVSNSFSVASVIHFRGVRDPLFHGGRLAEEHAGLSPPESHEPAGRLFENLNVIAAAADDGRGTLDLGDGGPDGHPGSVDGDLRFNDHGVSLGVRVMIQTGPAPVARNRCRAATKGRPTPFLHDSIELAEIYQLPTIYSSCNRSMIHSARQPVNSRCDVRALDGWRDLGPGTPAVRDVVDARQIANHGSSEWRPCHADKFGEEGNS